MIVLRALIMLALGGCAQLACGAEFAARVIAVLDGDTVLIQRAGTGNAVAAPRTEKLRLADIDAPEKEQEFGADSRQALAGLVLHRQVRVTPRAIDDYGRLVARLELNGLDVGAEQIRRGMAWEYSRFHRNRALVAAQAEARQMARGLWAQADPMPPAQWRKLHPLARKVAAAGAGRSPGSVGRAGCGDKRYCRQMSSCAEASHYFSQCGVRALDGNGDGVPCESLCRPAPEGN